MAYTPPTPPLSFNFTTSGYTPLTAPLTIIFVDDSVQGVGPSGVDSLAIGDAVLYALDQYITAAGFDSSEFGDHIAATDQFVYTSGIGSEAFGTPTIAYDQFVAASTGDTALFGGALVARQIILNFADTGYAPSLPLDFDFLGDVGAVSPSGVDSAQFGTAFIAYQNREIYPFGFVATTIGGFDSIYEQSIYPFANVPLGIGSPVIRNNNALISPSGVGSLVIAVPMIYNETPEVRPSGVSSAAIGSHEVKYGTLYITATGLLSQAFGLPGVSNSPHFITFSQALQPDLIGVPTLYGGTQTITIINQFTEAIGAAEVSYANREITPAGISSLGMTNQHLVKDSEQRFYPQSVIGSIGFAAASNQNRSILVEGVPGRFGAVRVYNSDQYIRMLTPFPVDPQKPGAPLVYNFDLEIRPQGVAELNVYPTHSFIAYQNRIFPDGIAGSFGAATIRNNDYYHPLDGVDSLQIGNQRVQNAAFGVYASSGDTAAIGEHAVARSLYRFVDGFNETSIGSAWVSHSPRLLSLFERGVSSLQFGSAFVANDPQYVSASGVTPAPVGYHVFQVRLLTLSLIGLSPLGVGSPRFENQSKEITPYAFFPLEVGAARFELGTRYLRPDGINSVSVGFPRVADQEQRIICYGGLGQPITEQVGSIFVYKVPGDPPGAQTIYASPVTGDIGAAQFMDGAIRPTGFDAKSIGTASVASYGVFPEGIHEDNTADTAPAFVYARKIFVTGVAPINDLGQPFHDMKHRTVWCTFDVTDQILANHQGKWEEVDYELRRDGLVGVGTPVAQNQIRSIHPSGPLTQQFGTAVISSYSPYIRPDGVPPPRVGMPKFIWRDNIDLNEFNQGPFTEAVGDPVIGFYVAPGTTLQVGASGVAGPEITAPRISNFLQQLSPLGVDGQAFGWHQFNLPYPPFQFSGVDTASVGTAFISNFIRDIYPEGFEALDTWETIGGFSRRMRVYSIARPQVSGVSSAEIGSPMFSSGVQSILVSDFVPTTVPGPVLGIQLNSVGGGQSFATLGDVRIDVVEEGKAKVYGVYPNTVPGPAFFRAIGISGVSGAVGSARLGEPAAASGISSEVLGAHVLVLSDNTIHTCGMATRAIAIGGVSAASVPEPELA